VEKKQIEVVKVLIENSVDLDISDNAGRTPLFEAIEGKAEKIIQLLIKNGSKIDATNYCGHTPLFCAAKDGNICKNMSFKS
jgi:ankyrin repeat protein